MSVEGVRVVRGPDWNHDDEDGGEGHVGTVTQDNEDDTVEVQWDMGESTTCSTGKDRKCDLRVLDSAPAGLKHGGIKCAECKQSEFPGTRWNCGTCSDIDLCTQCYFSDKHIISHPFRRIDAPGLRGTVVPKRSTSSRLRALGLYTGAKVKRGADWDCGNQDGGSGQIGTIQETKNYGTDGRERDAVLVKWPNRETNSYKVGYRGKVDLECVEEAGGMDYYRDHLFPMSTVTVPRVSIRRTQASVPLPKPKAESPKLQIGQQVCVDLPEKALKEAQRGHGGWSMRMKDFIGQPGTLKRFEENGDCVITYDGKEWRFNADAVRKMPESFKVGDIVRILSDSSKVQTLQRHHGGWQSEMNAVLGKVGKIVKIDSDGDVAVAFGNKAWVFNPACCEAAPGCKMFELTESSSGTGGGAAGGGSGRGDDDDDHDEEDEEADALQRLIAQMFLIRGQRTNAGPQQFIAAAANDNVAAIQSMLSKQPLLIDQKHKGLTALIISSHEGHIDVVKVLLKAGAKTDLTEEKGNTALMAALMKKRDEVSTILMLKGANVNLCNQHGRTALHFAAANGVNYILRELLRKGVDVNKQDITGDTPLHDAILNKNNTAVSFLVAEQKLNIRLCNKKGFSPLHLAAMKDDELSVSRILTKFPELKDSTKSDGYTALHIAAINDNSDVVKVLIKAKADVDRPTEKGLTPLHLSCHQGYIPTTKLLVENSADINAKDSDGDTPLHVVIMGRRSGGQEEQLARLLLGIRVENERETKDRTNLACYLIQEGAKVSVRNNRGKTALECCSNERMRNAVRMFAEKQQGGGRRAGATGTRRGQGTTLLASLLGLPVPCMGCQEKISDARLMPCGCRVLCKQCSFRTRECPMCGEAIMERYSLDGKRIVLADPCKVQ